MSLFLLQTLPPEMLNVYFPHFLLSAFLNFYTKRTVPFVYVPPPYRRGGAFRWRKRHFQVVAGAF